MLTINPIGDPIGAEILGADLSQSIDDATYAEIEAAFAEHSVVVLRDQKVSPDHQLAFARRLGELEINAFDRFGLEGYEGVLKVSNLQEDGKPIGYADAGSFWHTDMSYTPTPPRCTMLYAIEVPHDEDGAPLGETMFASAVDAYDALPPETKARVEGLRAIHSFSAKKRGVKKAVELSPEQIDKNPPVAHPVARTHPVTGRKAVYVTADECTGIEDMDDGEALALIRELSEHVVKPEFQFTHEWRVGDLLMWDNCAVQHVAVRNYEWPQRRLMHRVTVCGSVPF